MIDANTGEVVGAGAEPRLVNGLEAGYYRRSEQINDLFAALSKAQSKFSAAKKAGENTHFQSKYATLETVIDATREGLAENGLVMIQIPYNEEAKVGICTLLGHTSGQWIESQIAVTAQRLDAQSTGSVITYLRRYTWMSILGIPAEDDDGEAATKSAQQPAQDGAGRPREAQATSTPAFATETQRKALWAAVIRGFGGDREEAKRWLDTQFKAMTPPVRQPTELTVAMVKTLLTHIEEFARSEGSQEEPEFPDDEGEPEEPEPPGQQKPKGRKK